MNDRPDLLPGELKVSEHKDGTWLLVEIGRGRYTKRFNVSRTEAGELLREIERVLSG
jgi:hypothetical protein